MAESTEEVVKRHLEAFGKLDKPSLLADDTDQSIFIIPGGTVLRGPGEIGSLVDTFLAEFGKPGVSFDMETMVFDGELGYIAWKAETPDNVYETASDTFVVRDGKIVAQTMASKVTPKS